jgi:hypothetical protein
MTSARRCGLKNLTQSEMTHRKGPCSRPRKRRQRLDERYRSLFCLGSLLGVAGRRATAGFAGLDRTYAALGDLQHVSAGLLYRPASKAGQLRERSRSAWSLRRGQTGLSRSMDFDAVVAQLHADELEGRGEVERPITRIMEARPGRGPAEPSPNGSPTLHRQKPTGRSESDSSNPSSPCTLLPDLLSSHPCCLPIVLLKPRAATVGESVSQGTRISQPLRGRFFCERPSAAGELRP